MAKGPSLRAWKNVRNNPAMKVTKSRMDRDVRAIQWLVDNINGSNEMQTFVLAIPGSFNRSGGRNVWKGVVRRPVDVP
jgi:hypothetical protein